MENLLPVIRNAARALIIRNEQVLLLRKAGGVRGERYALPGGAQDPGETLEKALDRECREEIGTSVEIHDLLHVADFFKARDTDPPSTKHLVEFLFLCSVPEQYVPVNGHRPDKHQVEVVWTSFARLETLPLFPQSLARCLQGQVRHNLPVYLGVID